MDSSCRSGASSPQSGLREQCEGRDRARQRAADRGATHIQLPEYFNYLGPAKGFGDVAESIPGPITAQMSDVASSRKVTLHIGSLLEISPTPGKFFNTSVVINSTGHIVATYRKDPPLRR